MAHTSAVKKPGAILFHTGIYGAGNLLRALSSLLLLPLYTHYLSPADYGLVELLNVVVDLTALLLGPRIGATLFKFHADFDTEDGRRRVVSTILLLMVSANIAGVLILNFSSRSLTVWLDAPNSFDYALRCISFNLVFSAINETFFAYLRVKERSITFVIGNLTRFLLQLSLNVIFIVYLGLGYWGIIWASLLSNSLLAAYSSWKLWPILRLGFDSALGRRFVHFSTPIMLSALGTYYINFGNRYFLNQYGGLEAVGVYALAYKFGLTFLNLFWTPFSTHWSARQHDYARAPGAKRFFGEIFLAMNLVLLPAAVGVVVLAPHLLHMVAREGFLPAKQLLPWVVAASVLWCWSDFFRFGMLKSARTAGIAWSELATVVLISVLFVAWIPSHGATGAARAACTAYAVRLLFTIRASQKLFFIEVPWTRLVLLLACVLIVGTPLFAWPLSDMTALIVKPVVLLLASLGIYFSPLVPRAYRTRLRVELQARIPARASRQINS